MKPATKSMGVVHTGGRLHIVASQPKTCTPLGMAMSMLATVQKFIAATDIPAATCDAPTGRS